MLQNFHAELLEHFFQTEETLCCWSRWNCITHHDSGSLLINKRAGLSNQRSKSCLRWFVWFFPWPLPHVSFPTQHVPIRSAAAPSLFLASVVLRSWRSSTRADPVPEGSRDDVEDLIPSGSRSEGRKKSRGPLPLRAEWTSDFSVYKAGGWLGKLK